MCFAIRCIRNLKRFHLYEPISVLNKQVWGSAIIRMPRALATCVSNQSPMVCLSPTSTVSVSPFTLLPSHRSDRQSNLTFVSPFWKRHDLWCWGGQSRLSFGRHLCWFGSSGLTIMTPSFDVISTAMGVDMHNITRKTSAPRWWHQIPPGRGEDKSWRLATVLWLRICERERLRLSSPSLPPVSNSSCLVHVSTFLSNCDCLKSCLCDGTLGPLITIPSM